MKNRCVLPLLLILLAVSPLLKGQRIYYSEIEKDDNRQMNFEIIGKVQGNILVYKNYRNKNDLCVYDNEMKLKNKIRLDFMPDRVVNVDFVAYPDFFYMIYQFQKRNIVHCAVIKMDGEGKKAFDAYDLDTTQINSFGDNKIYSTINSEDKQKIMVFKINKRDEKRYVFTTLLFNAALELQKKSRWAVASSDREGVFTEFLLDNDGDLSFGRCGRSGNRDYINRFDLLIKPAMEDTFPVYNIKLTDKTLDEVRLKVDNINKRIIINSFYYKQRRGNIDGIYVVTWDKPNGKIFSENTFPFNDELRADAKAENASLRMAFNDYFIRNIIPKKDGGFLVIGELYYSTSRSGGWNRWDYLYGYNTFTPMDYWYFSPYSSFNYYRWWDPWNRWGGYSSTRHYYENVAVFSFSSDAKLEWTNFIRKTQYEDNSDVTLSYQLFNTGGELHFLFNQLERRSLLLNDQSVGPDGQIKRNPTLRNLDKGYEFMPRFGKQTGARQLVIPCMTRNYICFAKLDF
jgi:hypothetical protein